MPTFTERLTTALRESVVLTQGALPDRGQMPTPFPVLDKHCPIEKTDARWALSPLKRIPLSYLHATQRTVDADNVKKFIDDPNLGGAPLIVQTPDGLVIADGHHRASAARIRGEVSIVAHVMEDAAANAAGAGGVAGLVGDPPVSRSKLWKRRMDEACADTFAGADVFDVDMGTLNKARYPKQKWERFSKYVGVEEEGEGIRSHARKNWTKNIILRDKTTGLMSYLRKRETYRRG